MQPSTIIVCNRAELIGTDIGQEFEYLADLHQLSAALATNSCYTERVLIDYRLIVDSNVNVIDLVNTVQLISNLQNCAIPKLVVMLDKSITRDQLQMLVESNVDGFLHLEHLTDRALLQADIEQLKEGQRMLWKQLIDAILKKKRAVVKKKPLHLTKRQKQVLTLICSSGASNKVIARNLKISESTVKLHISCILKKYGVTNRTQLALSANQQGMM